jgi:hypothetical protein
VQFCDAACVQTTLSEQTLICCGCFFELELRERGFGVCPKPADLVFLQDAPSNFQTPLVRQHCVAIIAPTWSVLFSRKQRHVTKVQPVARSDRAALAQQVQVLVTRLHPTVTLERRRSDRHSIPVMFRLTPLAEDGQPMTAETMNVIGKNISRYGLSFYHAVPISYRRAWISLENTEVAAFAAEIDINWCRFSNRGWYESGGRLIAAMPPESIPPSGRPQNSDDRLFGPAPIRRTA